MPTTPSLHHVLGRRTLNLGRNVRHHPNSPKCEIDIRHGYVQCFVFRGRLTLLVWHWSVLTSLLIALVFLLMEIGVADFVTGTSSRGNPLLGATAASGSRTCRRGHRRKGWSCWPCGFDLMYWLRCTKKESWRCTPRRNVLVIFLPEDGRMKYLDDAVCRKEQSPMTMKWTTCYHPAPALWCDLWQWRGEWKHSTAKRRQSCPCGSSRASSCVLVRSVYGGM